jgi:type I restriction enzyme, R subunit
MRWSKHPRGLLRNGRAGGTVPWKYDEVLVRHAALAERYVFDDPNSALIKLRQFAELLAQHAAAYAGVAVEAHESQRDLIDKL